MCAHPSFSHPFLSSCSGQFCTDCIWGFSLPFLSRCQISNTVNHTFYAHFGPVTAPIPQSLPPVIMFPGYTHSVPSPSRPLRPRQTQFC